MKVLNVNYTLDSVHGGGTAERTFQMSRFLARSGIECTVLTTAAGLASQRAANLVNVNVVIVPLVWKRFFVPRISWPLLLKLVGDADIVHVMGHWSVLNALVYWAVRKQSKPYVVCPAGALPIYGRSQLLKRLYNMIVGKRLVRNACACIAITEEEIGHFAHYGVDKNKVRVIPNGINVEDFAQADPAGFRTKFGLGGHPFVLFVGRLNHIKGPDLLVRAFCIVKETFPNLRLVFAGPDGGMLKDLKNAVRANGINDRVYFIGYVSSTDKTSAYRAATLLAIPSRQEAMSIVVLEAGINGTPALLTDQCGFNVVDGRGGKVVPATVVGIARGLAELLAVPAHLKEMGEALSRFTREHYQWESVVRSHIVLYGQLLGERPRPES